MGQEESARARLLSNREKAHVFHNEGQKDSAVCSVSVGGPRLSSKERTQTWGTVLSLHTEVGCLCPSRALGERAKLLDAFVFQGRKVFARHAGSSHQTKSTGQPQTLSRTLGNRSSCRYLPPRLFHRHCRRDRGPRKQRVALRPGHH